MIDAGEGPEEHPASATYVQWIHPFYDGNGRVVRLMAHAMLLRESVGSSL